MQDVTVNHGELTLTLHLPDGYFGPDPRLVDAISTRQQVDATIVVDEHLNVVWGEDLLIAATSAGVMRIPFVLKAGLNDAEKKLLAADLSFQSIRTPNSGWEWSAQGRSTAASEEQVTIRPSHPASIAKTGRTTIQASDVRELQKAVIAYNTAPSDMPNKVITIRRAERIARDYMARQIRKSQQTDCQIGDVELLLGNFRERAKDIPDESIDVLFTDPPYAKKSLYLWKHLAEFAQRKLKKGGVLLAYTGAMYLPQVMAYLDEHLSWHWINAIKHSGRTKLCRSVQIIQGFKPIVMYYKPPLSKHWTPFLDIVSGGQSKDLHVWQQSEEEARHFISAVCPQNGVLIDPMMGSGSSLVGAMLSGKNIRCIGIEIDKAAYKTAADRIEKTRIIAEKKSLSMNNAARGSGKKYKIIYADVPWTYSNKTMCPTPYPTMTLSEIKSLPVAEIAEGDCALCFWTTMPKFGDALEVVKAWGFEYTGDVFAWKKLNSKNGGTYCGLGYWTQSNIELCLICTRGNPKRVGTDVKQWIEAPVGRHSAKPAETRARIIRLFGDEPRIELFARETTPGWVAIGNEIDGKDIRHALEEII